MQRAISIDDGTEHDVRATRSQQTARIWIDESAHAASLVQRGDEWVVRLDESSTPIQLYTTGDKVFLHAFGRSWTARIIDPAERAASSENTSDIARAPMPGVVVKLSVTAGDTVRKGQSLVIIESMKMQTDILASRDGTVERVSFRVGESFERGAPLVVLTAEEK